MALKCKMLLTDSDQKIVTQHTPQIKPHVFKDKMIKLSFQKQINATPGNITYQQKIQMWLHSVECYLCPSIPFVLICMLLHNPPVSLHPIIP